MYKIITNGERTDVWDIPYFKADIDFGSQIYEGKELIGTVKKEDLISLSFDMFELSITRNMYLLYDKIKSLAIYTKRQKGLKRHDLLILLKSLNSYKRNVKKLKILIPHISSWILEGKLLTNEQIAEFEVLKTSSNSLYFLPLGLYSLYEEEFGSTCIERTLNRCLENNRPIISFIEEYLKIESSDSLIDSFSRYEFILFNLTDYFLHVSKISNIPDHSVFSFYIKMYCIFIDIRYSSDSYFEYKFSKAISKDGIYNHTYPGHRSNESPEILYINLLKSKQSNLTDYFKQFGVNINSEIKGPPYLMDRIYFIVFVLFFPFAYYFGISMLYSALIH